MLPRASKKKQNRTAMFLIGFVVLMLVVVVFIKSTELNQRYSDYIAKEEQLDKEIAAEEERAIQIAEYETYTKTKAYVEEVARNKLGLVYEGEILFRDENQSK
ncbi:MAG: septum formation initiator family protein [Lachnospiraceae bacterium]|nr:septum formation initiator family protein [Lachnospiraceae bacterium]